MVAQFAVPLALAGISIANELFKNKKPKKRSTFDKRQKKLWEQYNQGISGEGPMADLYKFDPDKARENYMQKFGAPAYQKFKEEIIPDITGSFRSKGLGNSSYAGQALAREGRNVQNNINAGMNDYLYNQEQSVNDRRQNAIQNSLSTPTFSYHKKQEGPMDSLLSGAGKATGEYFTNKFLPRT